MSINISAEVKKYVKVKCPKARRIKKRKEVNLGLPCGRQKCGTIRVME